MILIIYYYYDRGKFINFINKFQNKESIRFIKLSLIVNLNLTIWIHMTGITLTKISYASILVIWCFKEP